MKKKYETVEEWLYDNDPIYRNKIDEEKRQNSDAIAFLLGMVIVFSYIFFSKTLLFWEINIVLLLWGKSSFINCKNKFPFGFFMSYILFVINLFWYMNWFRF